MFVCIKSLIEIGIEFMYLYVQKGEYSKICENHCFNFYPTLK